LTNVLIRASGPQRRNFTHLPQKRAATSVREPRRSEYPGPSFLPSEGDVLWPGQPFDSIQRLQARSPRVPIGAQCFLFRRARVCGTARGATCDEGNTTKRPRNPDEPFGFAAAFSGITPPAPAPRGVEDSPINVEDT